MENPNKPKIKNQVQIFLFLITQRLWSQKVVFKRRKKLKLRKHSQISKMILQNQIFNNYSINHMLQNTNSNDNLSYPDTRTFSNFDRYYDFIQNILEPSTNWKPVVSQFYNVIAEDLQLLALYDSGMIECEKFIPLKVIVGKIDTIISLSIQFFFSSYIGIPINILFMDFLQTPSGMIFFRNQKIAECLRNIMKVYGQFLSSSASCYYLNAESPSGWFCPEALDLIRIDQYEHQKSQPHYGFKSWNHFFQRPFKNGMRPVAESQKIITHACQNRCYRIQIDNLKQKQNYWLKNQPYSLNDIFAADKLNKHDLAHKYIGGTIYQGYLDIFSYHRYHSPVDGQISDVYHIEGLYFSEVERGLVVDYSQAYLTAASARLIIAIKADNPDLKTVTCVFVGIGQVSSCNSFVKVGDKVKKGDQIGHFSFGGSSHCVLFEKNVIKTIFSNGPGEGIKHKVNSALCEAN